MGNLSKVVNDYMAEATGLKKFCDRCLATQRWGGNVVLMVVDAAFDSIGLNYFNTIVPKVMEFEEAFVGTGKIKDLSDLSELSHEEVSDIWRNNRSWNVATSVASHLHRFGRERNLNERKAFRLWAAESSLEKWKENPIGKINGVGLTTFQYLRMMGGVDTSMPDKIVRRVVGKILEEVGKDMPTEGDIELIKTIDEIASMTKYRPIEICWMTWMVQSEGEKIRMEKYRDILDKI